MAMTAPAIRAMDEDRRAAPLSGTVEAVVSAPVDVEEASAILVSNHSV